MSDYAVRITRLGYTYPDGSKALEDRIRELRYKRPGDEFAITRDSFQLVGEDWVRRQVDFASPAPEPAKN